MPVSVQFTGRSTCEGEQNCGLDTDRKRSCIAPSTAAHLVNDVRNTVGREVVRRDDARVVEVHCALLGVRSDVQALERRVAVAVLDLVRGEVDGQDVVEQHLRERRRGVGEQVREEVRGQVREGVVVGRQHSEGAGALERVDEVRGGERRRERRQRRDGLHELHEVGRRLGRAGGEPCLVRGVDVVGDEHRVDCGAGGGQEGVSAGCGVDCRGHCSRPH